MTSRAQDRAIWMLLLLLLPSFACRPRLSEEPEIVDVRPVYYDYYPRPSFSLSFGFPLFGRQTLGGDGNPLDVSYHLVLPVLSLAIASIAGFSRYVDVLSRRLLLAFALSVRIRTRRGRRGVEQHRFRRP